MTTVYPAHITWPAMIICTLVIVVRYAYFNRANYETALTNALTTLVISNFLRERGVQDFLAAKGILSTITANQLSLVMVAFTACELMGFAASWAQPEQGPAPWDNTKRRVAALAVAIGFFAAATPARNAGQSLEAFGGWWSFLALTILCSILIPMAAMLLQLALHVYSHPDARKHERIFGVAAVSVSVFSGLASLEAPISAFVGLIGWYDTSGYSAWIHERNVFVEMVGLGALECVPILLWLRSTAGMDSTSRSWRRLQPLLQDVTRAAPDAVFTPVKAATHRKKTVLDLHQTVVQLRDGILYLRNWSDDAHVAQLIDFLPAPSPPDDDAARAALRLACAMGHKAAGAAPGFDTDTDHQPSGSSDLLSESREMLRLARWWPHAKRLLAEHPCQQLRPLTPTDEH